jgi:hypothetical protein
MMTDAAAITASTGALQNNAVTPKMRVSIFKIITEVLYVELYVRFRAGV